MAADGSLNIFDLDRLNDEDGQEYLSLFLNESGALELGENVTTKLTLAEEGGALSWGSLEGLAAGSEFAGALDVELGEGVVLQPGEMIPFITGDFSGDFGAFDDL